MNDNLTLIAARGRPNELHLRGGSTVSLGIHKLAIP